jgi:hypothetical protein
VSGWRDWVGEHPFLTIVLILLLGNQLRQFVCAVRERIVCGQVQP